MLLSHPLGQLSAFVQGIWSASVTSPEPVVKPLYSDGGSGIFFNLAGEVIINNETLPKGVIMLPVQKVAENITMGADAILAGIRFHPAIGYGVLGQHYNRITRLAPEDDNLYHLYQIYAELQEQQDDDARVDALYRWAAANLDFTHVIPDTLERALDCIRQEVSPGLLGERLDLSQRQIERIFKLWLGMTPKHYQRISRIKKAMNYLRLHKNSSLVDVAQQFGFSDQAHMTREFRTIACITPSQLL